MPAPLNAPSRPRPLDDDASPAITRDTMTRGNGLALTIVALLLRAGTGIVFIIAGVGKLGNATAATVATQTALGVGGTVAAILATAISVTEILLGVHLLIGLNLRWAAPATALLCAALLVVVIRLWVQGFTGGCGCFGVFGGGSPGPEETARDAALLLAALGAWATYRIGPALDRRFDR